MEPSEAVKKAGFSKSLDDCDARIRAAFPLVRAAWRALHSDMDLQCDYTYRGPELQFELYKKGRELDPESGQWVLVDRAQKVTDKDGTVNKGEHNYYPSKAADVYVTRGAEILWPLDKKNPGYAARLALYQELGRIWEAHGIVSGATWQYAWKDEPHVQVA